VYGFPNIEGCDWCLEARQAARIHTDEHLWDLDVLRESFAEWVGAARIGFVDRELVALAAASADEARRFEHEAERLIAEHDLFLVTSLYRRDGPGSPWQRVAGREAAVSDEEIEAELASFAERADDESLP
jgi:hypothetical protein